MTEKTTLPAVKFNMGDRLLVFHLSVFVLWRAGYKPALDVFRFGNDILSISEVYRQHKQVEKKKTTLVIKSKLYIG